MAGNYLSSSLAARFKGMGSALLDFFKGEGTGFSQSIFQGVPTPDPKQVAQTGAVAATAAAAAQSLSGTSAATQLTVKTQSGAAVKISLENMANGMTVKIEGGEDLNDNERAAIAKLSDAFQSALDGLAANPPHLDLSGLTQFDTAALSSVDLHADVTPAGQGTQTLDFHADAAARTVSVDGPAGALKVNVDLSNAATWGSDAQRADATNNYLKQVDQAATRGQGNADLVAMFKDAFSEMNSNYGTPPVQRATPLTDIDHAMLSGLADFTASVTQTAKSSNPMRLSELDTFSYQLSQSTAVTGGDLLDRSISQQQQEHLSASYHESLVPGVPLVLTPERKSQNYLFKQIDDSASSASNIAWSKGSLIAASLTQSASQSLRTQKYLLGDLVEDTTTPMNGSRTTDILEMLKPFLHNGKPKTDMDRAQWDATLSKIHGSVLLQGDPLQLQGSAA